MKKYIAAALCALCVLAPCVVRAEDKIEPPGVNAHGAILMDANTGRVLWGKHENVPLPMASTTKIMTAVLTLESGRLDETVTVSRRAAAAPKVKMNLSPGEEIRLGDLLLALMLESSNDAAIAIAEHLAGSVEDFCQQMTEKAAQLGATDTLFVTPNGLDAGLHHSTAYDLAVITRYALDVPGFVPLTNTRQAQFSSNRRSYSMHNKNRLLAEYPGANGVKTGFTNKAGHCFVGAAKRPVQGTDMQLISVVLASGWGDRGRAQKWADTKEILNYGFAHYVYEMLVHEDETAGTLPVTRSRTPEVPYAYANGVMLPLNREEKAQVRLAIDVPLSTRAPIQPGDVLGNAHLYLGDTLHSSIPLLATAAAPRHDYKTSLEKVLNTFVQQLTGRPTDVVLPEFSLPWEDS